MKTKKILGIALAVCMTMGLTTVPAMAEDKKTFVFGDTTFNAENEEADINPQNTYAGWACIRYGVGETLFRYSDTMEIEPWIAKEYENVDELTWKITLNDGVVFSNGRVCDGQAVKESLESLVENHERAAGDLCIDSIEADGNVVTIKTTEPKPALINYLSDPYGCIIDVQAGITDNGIVIGTGPYVATDLVTDDHLTLVKNENYWNGVLFILYVMFTYLAAIISHKNIPHIKNNILYHLFCFLSRFNNPYIPLIGRLPHDPLPESLSAHSG